MTDPPSLEEFASVEARGRPDKCYTCRSPYRGEIEAARARGISLGIIARWLQAHHPEDSIRELALRNHFASGHAEPS